ncbi:hypothetical protein QJQ45_008864 [Haematococcus lacustris]|nr:hypothetical protein QJQ45_008864 [Haematococcus lacustris]
MLRHYISPAQSDWPFFLSLAEFAVNNSWQESIQSTPFLVNTGQSPLTPALLELPGEVYCPSARKLSEWWQSNVKQARHFMEQAQQRQAYLANKGRRDVEYHPGQLVLLSTKNLRLKPGKAKKLLPRFIGPFKVLEHVGPVAVRLDLPPAMARMHPVFHVALLRPYTSEHPHLPPPVDWLDEAPLYEVEKLLAHRGVRAGRARGYLASTVLHATLLGSLTSHLTPTQTSAAEGPDGSPMLSEEELSRALKGCAHSKAPGLDGLPMEVAGYRPITLLNCDVRLVARAVEDRLQLPLDQLVSPSQSAFILGRDISDNVQFHLGLLEYL